MLLQATALTDPSGIWQFGALSEFDPAANFVQSTFLRINRSGSKAELPAPSLPETFVKRSLGSNLQDDWRWKPNLTLNLGLRYEMASVPNRDSGKTANLRHLLMHTRLWQARTRLLGCWLFFLQSNT